MSLNEKISAWFEPKPTVITATSLNSFAGYWRCSTLPEWGWYPLNYDTDEAANARLLEAMPSPMLFKSKQNGNWVCRPDYGIADYSPEHADRNMKANRERRNAWKRERYHDLYSTGRPPGRPRKVQL